MAASIGHIGDTRHPEVVKLYEKVFKVCKEKAKPFAVSVGAEDTVAIQYFIEKGVAFIGCGDDISYLAKGAKETFHYINTCKGKGVE